MSTEQQDTTTATQASAASTLPARFEVTTLPVADVDRAKAFYQRLGWRLDIDFKPSPDTRGVQFTPTCPRTETPGGHPVMRKAFHEELDRVAETLVEMTHLASSAMNRATTALLDADIHLADSVIAADAEIDARRAELDLMSFDLLARQQPVATDLRVIVTSMRMSSDLERMGDLARHVAKAARRRYPDCAVPAHLHHTIREMAAVAEQLVTATGSAIANKDVHGAVEIESIDDRMDELHRKVFGELLDRSWEHGTEAAVDTTLISRYYERFGDHAVAVADRIVYLVTGRYGTQDEGLQR